MSCWPGVGCFRGPWVHTLRRAHLHMQWRHVTASHGGSALLVKVLARTSSTSTVSPLPFHHSLKTFLHYAAQTNLSPTSTVFRGTKYEYTCLNSLTRLGFDLRRVGGAHDAGIDLEGQWHLPTLPLPLQAYVQCKFLTKKSVSPVLVRELEGASPAGRDTATEGSIVSVLCTPSLATKAVREAVRGCKRPLILASIDEQGWLEAVMWNAAMQDVCENVEIGLRYVNGRKQAVILINDQVWESPGNTDGSQSFSV